MDYFNFSSGLDPLDEDALAAVVEDLATPPPPGTSPPAPSGYGYVVPSQGMEPHRMHAPYVLGPSGSPSSGHWPVAASQQSVYVSAALPPPAVLRS